MLFISRKWFGRGGMQCWSRDFRRAAAPLSACKKNHIHLGDAALVPFGILLKKMGYQVTVTVHGLDVIWPPWWYQWMLKCALPHMDHVVCVSRATKKEVMKRGVREEKISVIPCGVWAPCHSERSRTVTVPSFDYAQDDTHPKLLTVGRLVKRKGHEWFIANVLPMLIKEYPKLEYWIVGEGPEKKAIESIIRKCGLQGHVRLLGSVSDFVREECYEQADLFIMPNIPVKGDMEGFGIAAIEASAHGLPVVAARLEGLKDAVIEGETGVFFESENVQDCITAIRTLLQYPSLREGKGTAFANAVPEEGVRDATIKHFSWPHLFQRYRDEVFRF